MDDQLMAETPETTGIKTKREAVEQGLRTLWRLKQLTELRKLGGKHEGVGDLDAMRRDKCSWSTRMSGSTSSATSRRRRRSGSTGPSARKVCSWAICFFEVLRGLQDDLSFNEAKRRLGKSN